MDCTVCKSTEIETLFFIEEWLQRQFDSARCKHRLRADFSTGNEVKSGSIEQCQKCHFTFASPQPSDDLLNAYYQGYHTIEKNRARATARLPRYTRKIQKLVQANFAEARTFLDIGCNVGTTVEAARRSGLHAAGMDIDVRSLEVARELYPRADFLSCSLEAIINERRKFDILHVSEVIEHVADIHRFAKSMRALLSDQGVLYLTTPDVLSYSARRSLIEWKHFHYPDHISLFSKASMKALLEASGFKDIKFQWSWGTKMVLTAHP